MRFLEERRQLGVPDGLTRPAKAELRRLQALLELLGNISIT